MVHWKLVAAASNSGGTSTINRPKDIFSSCFQALLLARKRLIHLWNLCNSLSEAKKKIVQVAKTWIYILYAHIVCRNVWVYLYMQAHIVQLLQLHTERVQINFIRFIQAVDFNPAFLCKCAVFSQTVIMGICSWCQITLRQLKYCTFWTLLCQMCWFWCWLYV